IDFGQLPSLDNDVLRHPEPPFEINGSPCASSSIGMPDACTPRRPLAFASPGKKLGKKSVRTPSFSILAAKPKKCHTPQQQFQTSGPGQQVLPIHLKCLNRHLEECIPNLELQIIRNEIYASGLISD